MQVIDRFQYFYPQKFDLYPFARFAMYQAAPDGVELTSYRFCILDEADNCRIINISKVYSTIGLPSLSSRMKYLIDEFPSTEKEIEYWLSSLERLTIENDKKIVFQKIELENSKVTTLNMVEVNIEK